MNQSKTVGEILKAARVERQASFDEITAATKIHPRFLKALEEGNYSLFSSPLHIKGFLKNYASFLGLNEEEVLAFWRREYDAVSQEKKFQKKPPHPVKELLYDFGPAFFGVLGVAILVIGFFGYFIFQYKKFTAPPKLLISQPQKDMTVETPEIDVFGVASLESKLTVNAKEIVLGEGGEFLVKVPLQEGLNLINIIAVNRVGKETKKTFKILYEKPKPPPPPPVEEPTPPPSVDEKSLL